MKFHWILGSALLCALLAPGLAVAQAPSAGAAGTGKIATINIQQAILETEQGKQQNAELQKRFEPRRNQLQDEQKALTALQQQLKSGGNTMSQEAKQDLTREIQTKQRDFQSDASNAQQDYQNAQTDLLNSVGNKLMPILTQYAQEHGYTAILDVSLNWPQSPILYHNPSIDITSAIIKLYNQKYPATASTSASGSTSAAGASSSK